MAARLAPIMIQIISVNHLAFIKGRQHVDGVVEVNEIIDLSWRGGNNSLIFKVYIEGLWLNQLRGLGLECDWGIGFRHVVLQVAYMCSWVGPNLGDYNI